MQKVSVAYDASVAKSLAQRLTARANSIVVVYTIVGFLLGLVIGSEVFSLGSTERLLCGGVLGFLGGRIGLWQAITLEFQAQLLLCQVRIERNTASVYRGLVEQTQIQESRVHPAEIPSVRPPKRMPTLDCFPPPPSDNAPR